MRVYTQKEPPRERRGRCWQTESVTDLWASRCNATCRGPHCSVLVVSVPILNVRTPRKTMDNRILGPRRAIFTRQRGYLVRQSSPGQSRRRIGSGECTCSITIRK